MREIPPPPIARPGGSPSWMRSDLEQVPTEPPPLVIARPWPHDRDRSERAMEMPEQVQSFDAGFRIANDILAKLEPRQSRVPIDVDPHALPYNYNGPSAPGKPGWGEGMEAAIMAHAAAEVHEARPADIFEMLPFNPFKLNQAVAMQVASGLPVWYIPQAPDGFWASSDPAWREEKWAELCFHVQGRGGRCVEGDGGTILLNEVDEHHPEVRGIPMTRATASWRPASTVHDDPKWCVSPMTEKRKAEINAWLEAVTRHNHIEYRYMFGIAWIRGAIRKLTDMKQTAEQGERQRAAKLAEKTPDAPEADG